MTSVIFLHGASSSGKSTIARALQAHIEAPFWHVSIDHLRDSGIVPMSRFRRGDFSWSDAREAFFAGFHAAVAGFADAGNNLIIEHILDRPEWLDELAHRLALHDVTFVGVHCPLPVLIAREAARGDRPIGSAAEDFRTIHLGKVYDLEVQSEDGVETNVGHILSRWRSGERSSSFSRTGIAPARP